MAVATGAGGGAWADFAGVDAGIAARHLRSVSYRGAESGETSVGFAPVLLDQAFRSKK